MPAILVYSGGVEARVARLTDTIKAHSALADKALQSGKPMSAQAWLPIIQRIERSLGAERQPQVRAILTMDLLNIAKEGGAVAPSCGKAVLREFPPSSTVWQSLVSVAYDLSNVAVMVSDSVTELLRPQPRTSLTSSDSVRLREYARHYASRIDSLIDSAPNESLRAQDIQFALFATRGWYPEKSATYLSRMQAEYADEYVTKMALRMFGSERLLRPGARLPAISVGKLNDTTQRITNTTLSGKTVLIDFWASWCLPCLGEMSTLHDAYTTFHSRGLEILSVSLDQKMSDVDAFRRARWPMPWQHAWISGGLGSPELKPLEITGIPRVVLIGPDGNILAEGSELRGGALQTTLERVLK